MVKNEVGIQSKEWNIRGDESVGSEFGPLLGNHKNQRWATVERVRVRKKFLSDPTPASINAGQ